MKVVVIGAGPCGIMASLKIKKENPNIDVLLIEKDKDIGSRIKVSGNGKCNLGNVYISKDKYNHPEIMDEFLAYKDELFSLLDEAGLSYFNDEEGRIYPTSESSLSVIHALKLLLNKYNVNLLLSTKVEAIEDNHVVTTNGNYDYDKLIIAIGGISYLNDRLNYNSLIKPLGEIITQSPSLTPISTSSFDKEMEGKRVKGSVSLLYKGKVIKKEDGEILFKKDGVSGICVFNISSYLSRLHINDYKDYELELDLLRNLSEEKVNELLTQDDSYINLLHPDIARYVKKNGINPKKMRLKIRNLYDFKNSQVTSGGFSLHLLNKDLSLIHIKKIHIGGEAIDIDGECGGFNIEFAFLCGLYIGGFINEKE